MKQRKLTKRKEEEGEIFFFFFLIIVLGLVNNYQQSVLSNKFVRSK